MKRFYILIGFVMACSFMHSYSQTTNFQWATGTGSTGDDESHSIATDNNGNVISTGYFQGVVDFDPGPGTYNLTATGAFDLFIQKLDPNGNLIWAKSIGSTGQSRGNAVDVDSSGNVLVVGGFRGTADFDPGPGLFNMTSSGSNDIFILKLNATGNFVWAKRIGSSGGDESFALVVDSAGYLYHTGGFSGTVDFDPGPGTFNLTSVGSSDIFVQKLDASGNNVWAKRMGSTSNGNGGQSIDIDDSGNVYTTGTFQGTVDFDPGAGTFNLTASGISNTFIQKLNSAGNFIWAGRLGGGGVSYLPYSEIRIDILGNMIISGTFYGTIDFDPGPGTSNMTPAGGDDCFVLKLDPFGNFIWNVRYGGVLADVCFSHALDNQGNIYTCGYFKQTVDFDPGPGTHNLSSAGPIDIFILKLDPSGNFAWAERIGSTLEEIAYDITINNDGDIFTTGIFQSTVDFDHGPGIANLTSQGFYDIFVTKWTSCSASFSTLNPARCDSYTSPSGNFTWTSSGTYLDTIPNAAGCDSLITVNLTISNSSTGSLSPSACNSYTSPSGNYTWTSSGTYLDTIPNAAGCDSVITVNLTISNSSTDALSPIACDSYTSPSGNYTWTTSGTYLDTIPNAMGCDSLITVNLTISNSSTGSLSPIACDSYTSPSGSHTWTTSGTYLDTIPNAAGCDSLITVNLTINNSSSGSLSPSSCDSYTSPSGNHTWTTSGTYFDTIPNAAGCDSVITVNLTISNSSTGSLSPIACDSYTSPSGSYTWTSSGTYLDTIPNAAGCDSLITVNLTINTVNTTVTNYNDSLVANTPGAVYQWLDCNNGMQAMPGETNRVLIPASTGSFAVEITENSCTDTSACYQVNITGIQELQVLNQAKVYPNPTTGMIVVNLGMPLQNLGLELYDILGNRVYKARIDDPLEFQIQLPEATGLYFLQLHSENQYRLFKILKQ